MSIVRCDFFVMFFLIIVHVDLIFSNIYISIIILLEPEIKLYTVFTMWWQRRVIGWLDESTDLGR